MCFLVLAEKYTPPTQKNVSNPHPSINRLLLLLFSSLFFFFFFFIITEEETNEVWFVYFFLPQMKGLRVLFEVLNHSVSVGPIVVHVHDAQCVSFVLFVF